MTSTTSRASSVSRPSQAFRVMLRGAFLPSVAAGLVAVVVSFVLRDALSAASALFGLVIATGFFASGFAIMARMVREASPLLFMAAALAVYMGQMIVLFLVFVLSGRVPWLDNVAVGLTILVVALVWQGASMLAWRRSRSSVYDPQDTADGSVPATAVEGS